MKIYKHEESLKDVILASTTSSVVVDIDTVDERVDLFKKSVASVQEDRIKKAVENTTDQPHPDLIYASAILVSTNMNLNDDIFLPEEVWEARNTPINTPYNIEHESTDIIGHIIGSTPVDKEGNELTSVADNFDLEVSFVMYKFIFPELAEDIVSKAAKGEKAVSMECILSDFDYGLIDKLGNLKVISRNEETSFLTKKLRLFGGTGTYNDMKIGRVLKGMRFVGMGSVGTPANPDSKYLTFLVNANNKFNVYKDLEELEKSTAFIYKDERGKMMNIKDLEQATEVIESLEAKVTEAEAKVAEAETKLSEATQKTEDLEKSVAELTDKYEGEKSKVEIAETKLTEAQEALQEKETKLTEVQASFDEASEKLDEIEKAKVLADRVTKLEELGIAVDDEKRKQVSEMSDDVFASTVQWVESLDITKADETETEETEESTESAASEAVETAEPEDVEQEEESQATAAAQEEEEEEEVSVLASLHEFLQTKQKPKRSKLNK